MQRERVESVPAASAPSEGAGGATSIGEGCGCSPLSVTSGAGVTPLTEGTVGEMEETLRVQVQSPLDISMAMVCGCIFPCLMRR